MQKVDRWGSALTNFLLLVSGSLIMLMAWLQSYGVVKRYIFKSPDPLAYEFSTMFLLFCGILAFAGVEKLNLNVRNDLVASRFSEKAKIVLSTIFPVLALVFVYILIWKSLGDAMHALEIHQVSQSPWAIPLAPLKFIIPVCYTLLALVLVEKFIMAILAIRGFKNAGRAEQTQ